MRRTLYWKRLLIVVVATLGLVGGVFAVHHLQAKSQSSVIKERAEKAAAAAEKDPAERPEAIRLYAQYLKFKPTDEGAFQAYTNLQFAEAKADMANFARVADGAEAFLRAFPAHTDERKKLVELYLATNQAAKLPLAKQHIEMLFSAPQGDFRHNIEVLEMAAACERGQGNLVAAIDHIEKAIATNAAPVRVYVLAMQLHSANKEDPKRNVSIDGHLYALRRSARFEKNLEARIAAARFELALKNYGPARDDLDKAFGLKEGFPDLGGSENPDALLALAQLELATIKSPDQVAGQRAKAETALRKAFGLDPKHVAVGTLLAEVLTVQGKRDEGVKVLKQTAEALGPQDDKLLTVLDRLIDLGEHEFSGSVVETKLAPDPGKKMLVTYFRGRLATLKADWPAALRQLEEVAPALAPVPEFHKKVMTGLAACYAAMQNPDKHLEYSRLALKDDPEYATAIVGEAEALARLGKNDEALNRYRAIVNAYLLTDFRPELVRLELLELLAHPGDPASRNWSRFEESLGAAPARTPEIIVYQADALAARGRGAEATKGLEEWLDANKKNARAAGVWVALARLKDGGRAESAAAVLDRAQKEIGDSVDVRLARAGLLVARAKPPTPDEFAALAAGADRFPKPDQFRLLFGLGQAIARVADRGPEGEPVKALRAEALRVLRAAADASPKDLFCRAVMLDQGLAAGRADVVEQAIREMAAIEGENGPVGTLARIAVRFPELQRVTDPAAFAAALKELREMAARVRELRPGWSRAYIALAQLDELEGLTDAALANYSEAIAKGDRQEYVVRKVVDLYRAKQQDDKAVGLLEKLRTEVRLPDDLERYRAIRQLFQSAELPKNARLTIDRNAPADTGDYRLMLLRGALLATIRDDDDALAAFRRAVELADKVPDVWGALVAQLMRKGEVRLAREAVKEAKEKLKPGPAARADERAELELALAGLDELIGDLEAAFGHYSAARALDPRGLKPTQQLVLFFQRHGQMEKGAALLEEARRTTAAPDLVRWARRHLALTLVSRPDAYNARTDALALVEENLKAAPKDTEDLKTQARIWTVDPVTREMGVGYLRERAKAGDLTPDEYYLLGRLAFDQGKYLEAEPYFKLAARPHPKVTAEHQAALVRIYLALRAVGDAQAALEQLKINFPTNWETTREEARVLARRARLKGDASEWEDEKKLLAAARAAVLKFPGWDAGPNLATRSGPLFEELGLFADAEAAYAKYLAGSKQPDAHAPLAIHYIRQKQPDKAIQLAWDHEKTAPVLLTARLLTGAVRAKRPGAAAEEKIARWLDDALRAAAGKRELEAGLTGTRAELFDALGEYEKAIKEYERAIEISKSDLLVNNLCMLIALKTPGQADDAVKKISEVIDIRGPYPAYLDTRAVAYLCSSRPAEAVKDLEMALVQYERPAYRYHLAWAIDLNPAEGKRIFAVDELKRAKAIGLTAADLHPLEFQRYTELFEKYKLSRNDK
ncbi:tetratricopeptide repeat protein [Frigoriglobus tundricola]|uniref:Tetratricopeptide repeat protein n=1 Tax=Frigoriglobus tundricola TaxID=2774151 RepID=A0A6M5YK45_9BACT|nr:tetratricopeptide repeat protein [Frigoriglobus tundricola]QJW93352.1 hypothetical protein FTUN_0858 [Frigoriglobus tundricola]